VASTTLVAPDAGGRLEVVALGVDGAGQSGAAAPVADHARQRLFARGIAWYTPGVNLRMSPVPAPGWPPRTFHRRHERCAAGKL
jgi:hypothetical protein